MKEKRFERRESFHLDLSMERKGIVKKILQGGFQGSRKAGGDLRRTPRPLDSSSGDRRPAAPYRALLRPLQVRRRLRRRHAGRLPGEQRVQRVHQPLDHRGRQALCPLGDDPGAVRRRVRHHHAGLSLRRRHHPAHRRHLLPLLLHPRGQRLFPAACAAGGPGVQDHRAHRSGRHPDGAGLWLRHHGDHGDPHPGDGAGAGHRHAAAGSRHSLLGAARRDPGAALQGTRARSWSGASA